MLSALANAASIPKRADPPSINSTLPVKSLGTMALSDAGFAAVLEQDGKNSLFVSSFAAFGSDAGYRINDIADLTTKGMSGMTATKIGGSVTWPNDITAAPNNIFGSDGIIVGGGFLVPGKSNGGIYFSASANGASADWIELYAKSGWFYHRVLFADIDNDGKQEMISCRAEKGVFSGASTMLVTLKPADATKPTGSWVETEIGPGCDALFTVADLNGDGIPEVIAASYFTSELNLFTANGSSWATGVTMTTLDSTVGAAFDVQVVDVNGDGKVDLLISNHQGDGSGGVYAYEIPADITNPKAYTRHTLASGFPVTESGFNQAAPGSATAFYPTPAHKSGPPYIALAGDAAQIAYILVPGTTAWSYTTTELYNCGCTVGKLAVADVNNDGYMEIIVPCYDNGVLAAFTFGK